VVPLNAGEQSAIGWLFPWGAPDAAYCSGTLYGFTYDDKESLFEVNQTTGVVTRLSTGVLSGVKIYAADCTDDGTLYALDGTNLFKASPATAPLSLVAALSGSISYIETMAVAGSGGEPEPEPAPAPLADTGFGVETAVITGLVAAALSAAGIVLVSRRRSRA
jgi:hypothetical protein